MFRKARSNNSLHKIFSGIWILLCAAFVALAIFILCLGGIAIHNIVTSKDAIKMDEIKDAEKVILVDVTNGPLAGIYVLSKNVIQKISEKRPTWKLVVAHLEGDSDKWQPILNDRILGLSVTKNLMAFGCFYKIFDIFEFSSDLIRKLPPKAQHCIGKIKFFLLYSKWLPDVDLMFDPRTTDCLNNFYLDRVTIVHDFLYYDIPKLMQNSGYMKRATETAVKNSNAIITVSKFSRNKIIDVFNCQNVHVIYIRIPKRLNKEISLEDSNKTLNRFNLKKDEYIVYPSALWKHKNHKRLIPAFEKYIKTYNDSNLKLVLLGSSSPESRVYQMIPEYLKDRIIIAGSVDDDTFQVILQNSKAVIQCSLYEGFGMTVLEGMAAGRPVAAGDVASIPEVAGDAVLYFDPYSVDDICRAIHEITTNVELQNLLIEKGKVRVEKFSNTDQMIDEYIKVLESVMNK